MHANLSTALVPVDQAGKTSITQGNALFGEFSLFRDGFNVEERDAIKKYLTDILGRVLARIWIEPIFHTNFAQDPRAALVGAGVHLPDGLSIEFSKAVANRPKIIVYERQKNSKFKTRLLYLQLVMLAGK